MGIRKAIDEWEQTPESRGVITWGNIARAEATARGLSADETSTLVARVARGWLRFRWLRRHHVPQRLAYWLATKATLGGEREHRGDTGKGGGE